MTPTIAETCDVTLVLGDGSSHGAHVVFSELSGNAGACPSGCSGEFNVSMTVDGRIVPGGVSGAYFTFQSATCVESDAGLDGSTDSATDAAKDSAMDAPNE